MPEGGVTSMQETFIKVGEHEEIIHKGILPRVEALEKEHLVFKQEMSDLKTDILNMQKGQKELEVTVMKDGKETRDLLKPFAEHVLRQVEFEAQTEKEIVIKKMDTKEKVTIAFYGALGTGGIASIVVTIIALFNR